MPYGGSAGLQAWEKRPSIAGFSPGQFSCPQWAVKLAASLGGRTFRSDIKKRRAKPDPLRSFTRSM